MNLFEAYAYFDVPTCLCFLIIVLVSWHFVSQRNLPPGPWGLPFVGYLPFLEKPDNDGMLKQLRQLSEKYGDVMSIQMGSRLIVFLSSYDAIKEAYVKQGDVFSGRPDGVIITATEHDKGLITSEGEVWKQHRRFVLATLRDYGMETKIMEEVLCFLNELAKSNGTPVNFTVPLGVSTANIIAVLVFGKRFEYNDCKFFRLRQVIDDIVALLGSAPVRGLYPWLVKNVRVVRYLCGQTALDKMKEEFNQFMEPLIADHIANHVEDSSEDYIGAFITEKNNILKKTGSCGVFGSEELLGNIQNLFFGGTETTTNSLTWAILFLVQNPEIQKKVQKEIDDVIGLERAPSMSDKSRMLYTEAVLLEVQRLGSIIPLNVLHSNTEETMLFGHRIPKRSYIMTNLWAVHRDPTLWKDPETFNPDRFFNEDGKIEKPDYLMPFGIGKRTCLGESLARMEMFLYFTSMLQRFEFTWPEGIPQKLNYEVGIVRRPLLFYVKALQRKGYQVC